MFLIYLFQVTGLALLYDIEVHKKMSATCLRQFTQV